MRVTIFNRGPESARLHLLPTLWFRNTWTWGAAYEEVVRTARSVLTEDDVLDGVADLVGTVKLECLFGDGTRVLHVERPIGPSAARTA